MGDVADVMGARSRPERADHPLGSICSDTRSLQPGQTFLALRGERFDGHRFCAQAVAGGAGALIVDDRYEPPADLPPIPILRVEDTVRAYGDLAAEVRRRWGGPVLAVSGSAGKTTTRRLVGAALGSHRNVLEAERNYNNLIGVPHTLLRLRPEHEIAVLELGMNQPGELGRLAEIAGPTAALLTQIGVAHVGMFRTMQELIDAKLDMFRGCASGTPLAINAACARTQLAIPPFAEGRRIVRFLGDRPPAWPGPVDVRIEAIHPIKPYGYRFDLVAGSQKMEGLTLRLFGRHHVENVAAAVALLTAAGQPAAWIGEALADFQGEPLRGEVIHHNGHTLILDCYNASPGGMLGAIEALAEWPEPGRRVLVLADMLELGPQTRIAHQMLLEPLRHLGPTVLLALGPECTAIAQTLAAEGWSAEGFETREDLIARLEQTLREGDVVLFKGSRGFALERVAGSLTRQGAPDPSAP